MNEATNAHMETTWGYKQIDDSIWLDLVIVGCHVEDVGELLKLSNEELERSKQTLRDIVSQVGNMAEVIVPKMTEHVNKLRNMRMAVSNEAQATIRAMKDVEEFFAEAELEEQMQRMQRFVGLCEQLKVLKQDGTLDAVSDTFLRLALKENQ